MFFKIFFFLLANKLNNGGCWKIKHHHGKEVNSYSHDSALILYNCTFVTDPITHVQGRFYIFIYIYIII